MFVFVLVVRVEIWKGGRGREGREWEGGFGTFETCDVMYLYFIVYLYV